MRRKCLFLLLAFFAHIGVMAQDAPKPLTEAQKIEKLIAAVGELQEAEFIRNGSVYQTDKAVSHLRLKLKNAGNKVKTAQDFIDGIAATSSVSGKPYHIKFKDGRQITAKEFLEAKLKEMGEEKPNAELKKTDTQPQQ
jgi:hypothetical protein